MILHLRNMQIDDVDIVYKIETNAHRSPWSQEVLRDCITVGYDCRVLELIKGKRESIAGYLICRYAFDTCHILNLCISNTMQNKGLGKVLLTSLLNSLAKPGVTNIILEVRPSNKSALKLYLANGFSQYDVKKAYYSDEDGAEDAIMLKRAINNHQV